MGESPKPSAVVRSPGSTDSERKLAVLCERTFLNLWSYPNVFRNQGQGPGGKGDGKELVDLLVICGDDLLLFSDKAIGLDSEAQNLNVAWSRWFRKAVAESAKQLRGAERWISSFSDRIFLDRKCTQKLVLSLPPVPQRRVHRIVVASGANEACKKYLGNTRGTLAVVPSIVGDAHVNPELSGYQPFSVGDLDPAQPFVHVFDDIALETLLTELDTITDFVQYLTRKEVLVRSGNLSRAAGEEELLAYYIRHIDSDG